MRKRKVTLLLVLGFLFILPAFAQQKLKFSIDSFESDPFDQTAMNRDYEKIDGSGARLFYHQGDEQQPR